MAASPAAAGSWGFGVGVGYGPPIYWGPPPVYYDYGAPIIVEPPPPYYYEQPPVVVLPPEAPPVYGMVEPDVVLDALEMAGYSDLQPMRQRGSIYRLNATDPDGNLVRLDISVHTGDIERERILVRAAVPPPPAGCAGSFVEPARQAADPAARRARPARRVLGAVAGGRLFRLPCGERGPYSPHDLRRLSLRPAAKNRHIHRKRCGECPRTSTSEQTGRHSAGARSDWPSRWPRCAIGRGD